MSLQREDEKDDNKDENNEESNEENVWQNILSQQTGRKFTQGHLVVLGSPDCGKTSLVGQFGRLESKHGDMKKFLMMRYSYTYLEQNSGNSPLLNIWQISEPKHCDVLLEVVPPTEQENLCWMIVLDISEPHLVEEEFKKWIEVCVSMQEKLLKRCDSKVQGTLKDKIYSHVQFYINPNDTEAIPVPEEEKKDLDLQRSNPNTNIGAPLITVLTKIDKFKNLYAAEAEASSYYSILTQYVRMWLLEYGGASFSMCKGLKDQARRILRYIDHRVFGARFTRGPSAVVSLSNLSEDFLFIPTGFDSMSIIKAQANDRSLEDPYSQYFKAPKTKSSGRENKKYTPKSNNDSGFLKLLEWELDNVGNSKDKINNRSTHGSSGDKNKDKVAVQKFFNRLLNNQKD